MDISQLYWVKPGQEHGPDYYVNEIFLQTNTIPTQCYFVNDNTALFVRFPQGTNLDKWHSTKNLKSLAKMGLTIKLSSTQLDKNSIFINSAPEAIFNMTQEALLDHINEANSNILAIRAYVPPKRGHIQKLGSVKLTVVSRNMTNSVLSFGIRIGGCHIEPGSIRQAHYLKQPQCTYCYHFHTGKCQAEFPNCPVCAQHHSRHQCREKDHPRCINCNHPHKATSNYCRVRSEMLSNEPINDLDINAIKCPFGKALNQAPNLAPSTSSNNDNSNSEWPPINNNNPLNSMPSTSAWGKHSTNPLLANNILNPLTPQAPVTSYYDVLRMSLMFDDWYNAFISLLVVFGLPAVEFPPPLRAQLKGKGTHRVPNEQEGTFPSNMVIPNINKPDQTLNFPHSNTYNQILNQHREAQSKAHNATQNNNSQDPFPLTGANTVPLPMRQKKDAKGTNKSTKGKGLLPTPPEPILPSSISLAPIPNSTNNKTNSSKDSITINSTKDLQWGDDDKGWITPSEDTPKPETPALDMPIIEGTQIIYTTKEKTQPDSNSKNRLSMDAEQFKTTIKNFEDLTGTKPKVPKKSIKKSQINQQSINNTQTTSLKTKFNVGSNKKISPKPKAIARPPFKHSTPSPQQEGICTSSDSDSDAEVNIDDVEEVEVSDEEQEESSLEDLAKPSSESTVPNRRQLRSNSKTSTNL